MSLLRLPIIERRTAGLDAHEISFSIWDITITHSRIRRSADVYEVMNLHKFNKICDHDFKCNSADQVMILLKDACKALEITCTSKEDEIGNWLPHC